MHVGLSLSAFCLHPFLSISVSLSLHLYLLVFIYSYLLYSRSTISCVVRLYFCLVLYIPVSDDACVYCINFNSYFSFVFLFSFPLFIIIFQFIFLWRWPWIFKCFCLLSFLSLLLCVFLSGFICLLSTQISESDPVSISVFVSVCLALIPVSVFVSLCLILIPVSVCLSLPCSHALLPLALSLSCSNACLFLALSMPSLYF